MSRRTSSTAATASATARVADEDRKPGHGARLCEPCVSEKIERPASLGRYGRIASFQLVGRTFSSGGMTKKIAAKAAIPPAVLRTIAPIASAKTPTSVR